PQNSESFAANINHTNLPSEEIRGVFVDEKTGDVYCATGGGLAILRSNPFTTPLPELDQVNVGPIPFILEKGKSSYLNFRNLTSNSQIKILTINGQLVRALDGSNRSEILGSFAQWDGKNDAGQLVSSGVYVYMITNEAGNSTSGKLVVIRK
ncbi:MAG: hypothetical protein WAN36_01295, partial [Calditrichia bacterium]